MKKILSFLSTFILSIPAVVSVVACAPKPETDVLFLLPGNVITTVAKQADAYRAIADDFNNSEAMKDSAVKVKVSWESGNAIETRYRSGQDLPDLYLSYADNVSNYLWDPNMKDQVRKMETSITGNEQPTQTFIDQFWSRGLYDEGVINNQLYVLPMNKSYDLGILNLKVLLELISFVNPSWANEIGQGLSQEQRPFTKEKTQLFTPLRQNQELVVSDNLKTELEKIVQAEQKSEAIRTFFRKDRNVLDLAMIYNQLFKTNLDIQSLRQNYVGADGNPQLVYSVGLETPENKIFMEYADMMEQSSLDPADLESAGNFFYNIKGILPEQQKAEIILDNKNSENFTKISSFFEEFRQMAPKTGTFSANRWSGSMITGRLVDAQSTVAGHYFIEGTMLLTSGTSAGSYDYKPSSETNNSIRTPQFNQDTDLMIVPASTATGNYANFFQQGSGIAGFKSTGNNASEKEKVVTSFLKYLLEPKNQNRLAIMAGYLPSTQGALERYFHYKNDDYDNETGKWRDESNKPENWNDFEQIPSLGIDRKFDNQRETIMTDFLVNFVLPKKLNVVTTKANPFGSIVRQSISDALKNHIFMRPESLKFEDLLSNSGDLWNVRRNILANRPGGYNNATVSFRN